MPAESSDPAHAATEAAPVAAPPPPPQKPSKFKGEAIRRKNPPAVGATTTTRPAKAKPAAGGLELRRVAIALAVVLGVIFLLRWAGRRFFLSPGGVRTSRAVQVLSRSPLSPRQNVVLLQVGRRVIVAADCGGQLSALCQITDPDEVASLVGQLADDRNGGAAGASFGSVFSNMRGGFDPPAGAAETGRPPRPDDPDTGEGDGLSVEDAALASTKTELSGLMEKVRLIARQFKTS